jgi:hypothetical protein
MDCGNFFFFPWKLFWFINPFSFFLFSDQLHLSGICESPSILDKGTKWLQKTCSSYESFESKLYLIGNLTDATCGKNSLFGDSLVIVLILFIFRRIGKVLPGRVLTTPFKNRTGTGIWTSIIPHLDAAGDYVPQVLPEKRHQKPSAITLKTTPHKSF